MNKSISRLIQFKKSNSKKLRQKEVNRSEVHLIIIIDIYTQYINVIKLYTPKKKIKIFEAQIQELEQKQQNC